MLVLAWILLYFSIGIGLCTVWQVTVAQRPAKGDDACIVLTVVAWPMVMSCIGIYHAVRKLVEHFEDKYRNPDSGE